MKELMDFIHDVIERYQDVSRDGYNWLDAVVDILEERGFSGWIGEKDANDTPMMSYNDIFLFLLPLGDEDYEVADDVAAWNIAREGLHALSNLQDAIKRQQKRKESQL